MSVFPVLQAHLRLSRSTDPDVDPLQPALPQKILPFDSHGQFTHPTIVLEPRHLARGLVLNVTSLIVKNNSVPRSGNLPHTEQPRLTSPTCVTTDFIDPSAVTPESPLSPRLGIWTPLATSFSTPPLYGAPCRSSTSSAVHSQFDFFPLVVLCHDIHTLLLFGNNQVQHCHGRWLPLSLLLGHHHPAKSISETRELLTVLELRTKMVRDLTEQCISDMHARSVLIGILDPQTGQHTAHRQADPLE